MSKKNIKIGIVGGSPKEGKTTLYREIIQSCHSREYNYYDSLDKTAVVTSNVIKHISNYDGIVLVVSPVEGISPTTRELILLMRQLDFDKITIFISKCDLVENKEAISNLELELYEILEEYDYSKSQVNIIKGTSKSRDNETSPTVVELINLIESSITESKTKEDFDITEITSNREVLKEKPFYNNRSTYYSLNKSQVVPLKRVKTPFKRRK